MTEMIRDAALLYGGVMSLWGAGAAAWDKLAAIRRARRIPERKLLLISALGGSAAMLLTMLLIRHKTRRVRFMAGIPLMLSAQAVLVGCAALGPDGILSLIRRFLL